MEQPIIIKIFVFGGLDSTYYLVQELSYDIWYCVRVVLMELILLRPYLTTEIHAILLNYAENESIIHPPSQHRNSRRPAQPRSAPLRPVTPEKILIFLVTPEIPEFSQFFPRLPRFPI